MLVRMSRQVTASKAEVSIAVIAIAIVIGLLYLYLGWLAPRHGPEAATEIHGAPFQLGSRATLPDSGVPARLSCMTGNGGPIGGWLYDARLAAEIGRR